MVLFSIDNIFSLFQGYMLYTIPPVIRFIRVHFSLSLFFIHLCVQFCSYLCIILFCLLHVLILCIVYLCILCILRSSLWLLYCNKRVCITLLSGNRIFSTFQPESQQLLFEICINSDKNCTSVRLTFTFTFTFGEGAVKII